MLIIIYLGLASRIEWRKKMILRIHLQALGLYRNVECRKANLIAQKGFLEDSHCAHFQINTLFVHLSSKVSKE